LGSSYLEPEDRLQAERAHDEAVLVAPAAPRRAAAVQHLPAAGALAAHHEIEPPARLAPALPALRRRRVTAGLLLRLVGKEGSEAAVLVEREHLRGAAEVAAAHEEARGHGPVARERPQLVPEAAVHGHVALLEGRAQALQHRAHAVAVLERPPHAAERRGVQHHATARRAPGGEPQQQQQLVGGGGRRTAIRGHELPRVQRLRLARVVGEGAALGRGRRVGRFVRERAQRAQDARLQGLEDHGGGTGRRDRSSPFLVPRFRFDLIWVSCLADACGKGRKAKRWRREQWRALLTAARHAAKNSFQKTTRSAFETI
jgi:hypothetical protein